MNVVVVCTRPEAVSVSAERLAEGAARAIDGPSDTIHRTETSNAVIVATGVCGSTPSHDRAVCTGMLTRSSAARPWWRCDGERPDGSFACIRTDDQRVELVTDVLGSRTLWYVKTDVVFAASTSQRALVSVLGDFEPNDEATSWMLWSGSLGTTASWDRRIQKVPPDAVVRFSRSEWTVDVDRGAPVSFVGDGRSPDVWERELREAVQASVASYPLEPRRWPVTLSGGVDSRGLAAWTAGEGSWSATWGDQGVAADPRGDKTIAHRVAEALDIGHRFYPVHSVVDDPEAAVERLVRAGDARIDHLGAALDPVAAIAADGAWGLIRGDKVFGSSLAYSRRHARLRVGLSVPDDFADGFPGSDSLAPISVPPALRCRPKERLDDYRDRIYTEFLFPAVVAALTQVKASTVDVACPYITRDLVELVRKMPSDLRTDKRLFKRLVVDLVPDVPFAARTSTLPMVAAFTAPPMKAYLLDQLASSNAKSLLPARLVGSMDAVVRDAEAIRGAPVAHVRKRLKKVVPRLAGAALYRARGRPRIDRLRTAYRAVLVLEAHRQFSRDTTALSQKG